MGYELCNKYDILPFQTSCYGALTKPNLGLSLTFTVGPWVFSWPFLYILVSRGFVVFDVSCRSLVRPDNYWFSAFGCLLRVPLLSGRCLWYCWRSYHPPWWQLLKKDPLEMKKKITTCGRLVLSCPRSFSVFLSLPTLFLPLTNNLRMITFEWGSFPVSLQW